MLFIESIFKNIDWFINALLIVFLIYLIVKIFHINPLEIFHILANEFKDLLDRNLSLGSLNMMCLICVIVFGFATFAVIEIDKGVKLLQLLITQERTNSLKEYVSFSTMFYVVIGLAAVSVVSVLIDNLNKRK